MDVTARDLFGAATPERWLTLGFLAFLDQCGRSGGASRAQMVLPQRDTGSAQAAAGEALRWLGQHAVLSAVLAGAAVAVGIALTALVLWVNSRGTFMYLDNVASGRSDVARPWREHADRAASYFAWSFGLAVATFVFFLALLVPVVWSVMTLAREGRARVAVAIVVLVASLLVAGACLAAAGLLSLALRDFAAPIQWYEDVSCTEALRRVRGLVLREPLLFLVYVLLKAVFGLVVGTAGFALCCVTCCVGMMPVVFQTLLQPLFYFERRWSLELLHGMGYAPPSVPSAPPTAVPPAMAPILPPMAP
jgi:hypothetical protein